jgi:prolyl-tRNA editing enzyme YbaK/EbsC (Cys-tRNA(Pro) deacylase)
VTAPLGPDHLTSFCRARGIAVRLLTPGVPTPTVAAAAAALGVARERILKSLVFWLGDAPFLVIAAGDDRISMPHLAAAQGVTRRGIRLATPPEALAVSGYPVGAMPPFGHLRSLPTLVDERRFPHDGVVVAGGGARDALLEVAPADLLRITSARVVALGPALTPDSPQGGLP